uniref:Non-specific serine/threonine protein kinase n=1 Tax=Pyrodinium bahamense TaxID=73915 RepID=A0A7S0FJV3_9DINO
MAQGHGVTWIGSTHHCSRRGPGTGKAATMGQCSNRVSDGAEEFAPHAVSLEKAKSLSSNAAVTAARYHYSQGGKILADDYTVEGTVLGQGLCGDVVLAYGKIDNRRYALKTIRKTQVASSKLQQLTAEVEIYLSLDHPNICRLHDVYETEADICLLTECCEGGELYFRLQRRGVYTDADAAEAARQMLRAVGYLHSHRVVHRDLKLENFLYESEESSSQLKLIDFGFAYQWNPSTLMKAPCGSISYVSPDVLSGQGYTNKCDLWSLGVIVFILLVGYMPFSGSEEQQIACIQAGRYTKKQEPWSKVSNVAQTFVKSLLTVDPEKRLSAEQALEHPFIKDSNRRPASKGSNTGVDDDIVDALRSFKEATQFRRACLSVMAWSLTNEERAQVRDAFIEIDKSRQGTITMGELKQVLGQKFEVTDEQIKPIFEALDTSHNEEIHYSEFLAAMVSTRIAMHDDLLSATFRRFDIDNSGFITQDNMRTVLGESFDGAEVEELMKEADVSNDGKISYEEFIEYMKNGGAKDAHAMAADKLIEAQITRSEASETDVLAAHRPQGFLGLKAFSGSRQVCPSIPAQASGLESTSNGAAVATHAKSKACILL